MAQACVSPQSSALFDDLVARISRALQGRDEALIRVEIPIDHPGRTSHAEAHPGAGEPWFSWTSQDRTETFHAQGSVQEYPGPGGEGGSTLSHQYSVLCEQTLVVDLQGQDQVRVALGPSLSSSQAPLWVGGLGFSDRGGEERDSPWRRWSSGRMWIPRSVVATCQGRSSWTRHRPWSRGDSVEELVKWALAGAHVAEEEGDLCSTNQARGLCAHGPEEGERETFLALVQESLRVLERGAAQKIVLARSERFVAAQGQRFDVFHTLRALAEDQPHCDVFALGHEDGSVFLGASPERLVRVEGSSVRSVALAGTAERLLNQEADREAQRALLSSDKEQREHRLVVDAIAQTLAPFAQGSLCQSPTQIRSLSQVHHLETELVAEGAADFRALDLLRALHPTPATCGWPQDVSQDWIAQHEGLDRGWYGGPVGWLKPSGDATFCVALRCALIRESTAYAFAGAGIVRGSSPEREFNETAMKLRAIAQSLRTCPWDQDEERP